MPKHVELIARGLLIERDSVLLCRNLVHNYSYLPGGHVELGEPSSSAVAREFLEECGTEITVGPPLFISELIFTQRDKPRHEVTVVFHVARRDSSRPIHSLEPDISFHWATQPQLPSIDLRPTHVRHWLLSAPTLESLAHLPLTWVSHDER